MARAFKTERNLAQFASKKVVGRAHTRGDISDLQENIPSGVQMSTETIFGEGIPGSPANAPGTTLWGVTSTVQYVELDAVVISGTNYDADSSSDLAGDDTPQNVGPHAWYLKLPSNYETVAAGTHVNVGFGEYTNNRILYQSLGKLQVIPTSFYLDTSNPANNPYAPKIYTWDGSTEGSKSTNPLGPADTLDWFFDPYNGVVFFQEYDGRVPYKVGCYIYVGKFAPDVSGGGGGGGSAISGVQKYTEVLTSDLTNGSDLTITGLDLQYVTYEEDNLQVYLNGQHLLGGTAQNVVDGIVDYHVSTSNNLTYVRFSYDLNTDDVVSVVFTGTESLSSKPFLIWQAQNGLDGSRVITAGDGISITTPNPTTLLVSNTGLLQRVKTHKQSTAGYLANSGSDIFTVPTVDFSSVGYVDSRIDIFLDGVMLLKGIHYELTDTDASLQTTQFRLLGSTVIQNGDIVTVVLF